MTGGIYNTERVDSGGEGLVVAEDDRFIMSIRDDLFKAVIGEEDIDSVTVHASTTDGSVVLMSDARGLESPAFMMAYLAPDNARALAAQLEASADAVEQGEHFSPEYMETDR